MVWNKCILLSLKKGNWKNLERGMNTYLYTKSEIFAVLTKLSKTQRFQKDIHNKRNKDIPLIHIFAYGIL